VATGVTGGKRSLLRADKGWGPASSLDRTEIIGATVKTK
jgi:hypothetical protein